MAEEYTLIDDIIRNHSERILNLRKFYPFFTLIDGTFAQYHEGEYRFLDMGYITLAVLRYFINENSFNDSPVTYASYADFCRRLLARDYGMTVGEQYSEEDISELVRYIFDKLRNYGRAFEFTFFDPAEHKDKIIRVRLIDSSVLAEDVVYNITEDGIEFYLSTKEVRDESRINMDQLLLEKLIKSENFAGSMEVIERINIEVKALEKKREEVVALLITDVHAGSRAVDEYMDQTSIWFAEERKSFARNRELVDKAVSRMTYGGDNKTARDITRLQTSLKQTIESHSALIAATAELSRFSDEMIRRSRTRSLRVSFDYENVLNRMLEQDRPDMLTMMISPFLLPRRRKSLAISSIDNIVLQKTSDSLRGETKDEAKADLSFRYEDEILSENIGRNFARLFTELLARLRRWERLTLSEYNAILEVKFGTDIYKNRDYYSFLTHLAGKDHYSVDQIRESAETFLEEMVLEYAREELEDYQGMAFSLEYSDQEIELGYEGIEDIASLTEITFTREGRTS